MTLAPACGTERRLDHEIHESHNTAKMRDQLDKGKDVEGAEREQLSLEEFGSLPRSSGETNTKRPIQGGGFLKHDLVLFSCDEECRTPTPGKHKSVVTKNGSRRPSPETAGKNGEMKATGPLPRAQTQEEKIRERSRKGRERSLRTRRRNIARLKLLEENCVHLSRENKLLRDLVRSLAAQDDEKAGKLFNEYRLVEEEKPEPHKLMHPESYYMSLLSPLSVTVSADTEETCAQNVLESLLPLENCVKPNPCEGLHDSLDDKNSFRQQETISCTSKESSQVNLNRSRSRGRVGISVLDDSVFADPAYGDGKQFGFSLEEVCNEAVLSAEEIVDLVEQGARARELPSL